MYGGGPAPTLPDAFWPLDGRDMEGDRVSLSRLRCGSILCIDGSPVGDIARGLEPNSVLPNWVECCVLVVDIALA